MAKPMAERGAREGMVTGPIGPALSRPSGPTVRATTWDDARNFVVHLRLPFQLTLAPFMLWGAAVSHARLSARFGLAFVVLQVCFYGGTTAFNSHYDRDEGPVGGLETPPPPGPWLLPGSLALQGLGLGLAALIDARLFTVYLVYAVLGVLYSHPSTRWKARPYASWAVVMFGQGALAALAGVVAGRGVVTPAVVWGLGGAAAFVGALYPLTQLFQVAEDTARGDVTAAIALGRRGACAASIVLSLIGAACLSRSAQLAGRPLDAMLLALAGLPMTLGASWVCRPVAPRTVFRRISVVQLGAGAGFGLYTVFRLLCG